MLPPDRRQRAEGERHRPTRARVHSSRRVAHAGGRSARRRHEVRDNLAKERQSSTHRIEATRPSATTRTERGEKENGRNQHAEKREREVDDPPVEILPRTVRAAGTTTIERARSRGRNSRAALRTRSRSRTASERSGASSTERPPNAPARTASPRSSERRIGRPVAEEERERHERAGCADQGPGGAWEARRHRGRS